MKPYGQVSKMLANIPDNHPPKGYVNWWEVERKTKTRPGRARMQSKEHIQKELLNKPNTP